MTHVSFFCERVWKYHVPPESLQKRNGNTQERRAVHSMSVCHEVCQHILHSKTTNARWCKLVLGFVMNNCKCPGIFAFGDRIIYSFELFLCHCLVVSLFEFYLGFLNLL